MSARRSARSRGLADLARPSDGLHQALANVRRREEHAILRDLAKVRLNDLGVTNSTVEKLRDLQSRARRYLSET